MLVYEKMVNVIPPGVKGVAQVIHVTVSEEASKFGLLRMAIKGNSDEFVRPGDYVHLMVKGQLMMSDTTMEKNSNYEVLLNARGHVLIAGLGIGMVLLPILKNPKVLSVTVVEKYQDVIDLVFPHLQGFEDKLKVVQADIFEWKPEKGTKYDCIYFDIWPIITFKNLPEMATLHRRFARCKAPGGWMGSWMRDRLQALKRREERSLKRYRWSF